MDDLDAFARSCKTASRNMRRLPKDLRRELGAEVQTEVAEPLAGRIRSAAAGPYRGALSTSVKARKLADPTIVIGGTRKVVSGGANARQLVYGTEFGGGSRVSRVSANGRHRGYRRRSTRQFARSHPFIFSTIGKSGGWVLEQFADVVNRLLGEGMDRG